MIRLLILALVLCAPLTVVAQETLLVVRQEGDNGAFETVSDALDEIPEELSGNYVIEIRDNETYEEQVKVDVKSSAQSTVTIRAGDGNTPSIVSDKKKKHALTITSPFVTVEGLRLRGGEESSGLHIDWADDVTIRNCEVDGAEEKDTAGLFLQGAQRALIENNTIRNNVVGIRVYDAEDEGNTIRFNRIYNNRKRGLWLYKGTANSTVVNNTIYHNTIEIELGNDGKKNADAGPGNTFRNNIVVAHENDGFCVYAMSDDAERLPDDTFFDYNLYYTEDDGTKLAKLNGSDLDALEDWQDDALVDQFSLDTDPLLVSPTGDLHPQSTNASFHGGAWTADGNHSPAIDAGDPDDGFANETDPNGGRINIGAWGNTAQASRTVGSVAAIQSGSFAGVQQGTDGTGAVAVSVEINHSTGGDTRARIEWSDAEGGTYQAATLAGPVTADVDDSGGAPSLDNGASYQLGNTADTRIVTSEGSNTVAFTWSSATDAPAADGSLWLRLTVNDDETEQQTSALQQVAVDNVAPTAPADLAVTEIDRTSLAFAWTASGETNFAGYSLWYGTVQSDVENRSGGASLWGAEQDGALASATTAATTVTGLERGTQYFGRLWAADVAGHESSSAITSSFTAGRDTVFHYVATSGENQGTENDRSDPWNTIQRAINAIPGNLTNLQSYYVVEVLDSGRYDGKVTINRQADATYSITVRPAAGQTPTIVGPGNKDAVLIKTAYAVLTGFRIEVGNKVGIIVDGEPGVLLRNLVVGGSGNTVGIRLVKTSNTHVVDTRINDADIGIHLANNADNNGIHNVQILGDGSRARGVFFDQKTDADSLVNVTITGYDQGLFFRGGNKAAGDGHMVRNSILHKVGTAIRLDKALGSTFGLLDYNDLHPVDGGHVGRVDGADFTSLTDWRGATGLDEHSMSLDPLLVNADAAPASMDVHVSSQSGRWDGSGFVNDEQTSPTIDSGHPRDAFDSETAPNGNRINLGAWGNTPEASRSGDVNLVQGGLPWATYLMAGIPVTPRDGSPEAVLADDFPGQGGENIWGEWVRLIRWDTAQQDYVYHQEDEGAAGSVPNLQPGLGYWLIQWWSIIDDNGNSSGDSVTVAGTLVSSTEDFVLPLTVDGGSGFNQLANPFNFDIDWANTLVRDVASGQTVSIAEAAEREVIDGHAYHWDWEEQTYLPIDAQAGGRIRSWRGFWVDQLATDRRLELLIPPVEAASSLNKTLQSRPSPDDWYIEFGVQGVAQVATESGPVSVPMNDPNNRAGVHVDASRRWDPLDALDLTGLRQPSLNVYFPHGDEGDPQTYWPDRPQRYTYDLRDPDWLEQTWEFAVETEALATELTWLWTNPGSVPSGFRVALEDADTDSILLADISVLGSHTFTSGSMGVRRFRLRAAYEDVVGDVSGDRVVEAQDALQVLRHAAGLELLSESEQELARVRTPASQSDVTALDAAWILRFAEGRASSLPVPAAELDVPQPSAKALFLSTLVAQRDNTQLFPIYVDEAEGVLSGNLRLSWDATRLRVLDVTPGSTMAGFQSVLSVTDGQIDYTFAGAQAPGGRQVLANVQVQPVIDGDDLVDYLAIDGVTLNDGRVAAKVVAARPQDFLFYPAAPNPFNSSVTLRFGLPEAGTATLSIYNVLGQRVRVLTDQTYDAGLHHLVWDGRDASGHGVASGVYLAQLVTGERTMVQRLALIR